MKQLVGSALLFLILANPLVGQAPTDAKRVMLEVVVSQYEGDRRVSSQPFNFLLALDMKGSLKITGNAVPSALSVLPGCDSTVSSVQAGSVQVDAVVTATPSHEFSVSLDITDRSMAGCREIGGLSIPVIANRKFTKVLTLRDGEATGFSYASDKAGDKETRVDVSLKVK